MTRYSKLVNTAVPGTIDERVINVSKLDAPRISENFTLFLNSARAIGCRVRDIKVTQLVDGDPELLVEIAWQVVRAGLLHRLRMEQSDKPSRSSGATTCHVCSQRMTAGCGRLAERAICMDCLQNPSKLIQFFAAPQAQASQVLKPVPSKSVPPKQDVASANGSDAATNGKQHRKGKGRTADLASKFGSTTSDSDASSGGSPGHARKSRKIAGEAAGLMKWCLRRTNFYDNVKIVDFDYSWSDGLAFCALINSYRPSAFDYDSLTSGDPLGNLNLAFSEAKKLGIYPLLDAEDVVETPESKSIMTYLASIYQALH